MAVSNQGKEIASQTIGTNTTTTSSSTGVNSSTKNIIGVMKISSRTDGTYVLHLQHSHDGTNWETLVSGGNVTANDTVYVEYSEGVDGACFGQIRLAIVSTAVTTGATAEASLHYD